MTNNSLTEIAKVICGAKVVAVCCHARPDGDALGSLTAMCVALTNAGKEVYLLCEEQPPEKLCITPSTRKSYQQLPVDLKKLDLFITVDCSDVTRLGTFGAQFCAFKGATVNIDHHVSNTKFAKYNYVFADSTATCEIMPEVLDACGFEITGEIADALAMGLLTDSGNFSHRDVSAKTFAVASKLKEYGANFCDIGYEIFIKQSKARAILYARALGGMRFALQDKLVFITVTQQDFEQTGTYKSDTEGFVDFGLSIDGVEVSVAIMEVRKNQYKVSLRSRRVNVNAVASEFGGGGHVLASGCMLNAEYEEVVERLTHAVYRQL